MIHCSEKFISGPDGNSKRSVMWILDIDVAFQNGRKYQINNYTYCGRGLFLLAVIWLPVDNAIY